MRRKALLKATFNLQACYVDGTMKLDDRSTIRREDEWQDDTIIGTFYTVTYLILHTWTGRHLRKQAYAYGLGAKTLR